MVDTSVFVAALLGAGGPSRRVLRAGFEGKIRPLIGAALFCEYESLLGRPELYAQSSTTATERETLFDALMSVALWTTIYVAWRPNLPDEADNHLVELAVAGGAAAIVTNNQRDFNSAELLFPGLKIRSPEALIKEVALWQR